jgi:hypothetical protein
MITSATNVSPTNASQGYATQPTFAENAGTSLRSPVVSGIETNSSANTMVTPMCHFRGSDEPFTRRRHT